MADARASWPVLVPALVLVLVLAAAPLAADYRAGFEAYRSGDYAAALREWRAVADAAAGEVHPAERAEACYAIGMLYWNGHGVTADLPTSSEWLRQGAELGHAGAQAKLGFLYLSGQGVPRDEYEALKWLQMAAHQGDADAQYNLGVMYRDGHGVERNPDIALQWFSEAAAQGDRVSAQLVAAYRRDGRFATPDTIAEPSVSNAFPTRPVRDEHAHAGNAVAGNAVSGNTVAGAAPEAAAVPAPEAGAAAVAGFDGQSESWIRERDPGHYTLQIIAVHDPSRVVRFVAAHPEWQPFALLRQQSAGRDLWILLQGDYLDSAQAQQARIGFPDGLVDRSELWVRSYREVQALLN